MLQFFQRTGDGRTEREPVNQRHSGLICDVFRATPLPLLPREASLHLFSAQDFGPKQRQLAPVPALLACWPNYTLKQQ